MTAFVGSGQETRQDLNSDPDSVTVKLWVLLEAEFQMPIAKAANKACSKGLLEGLHQITQKAASTMRARHHDSINNSHDEEEED